MSRVAAYQNFRERLLSGELSPGQFVTQKELADLAGVPIATAREAIQKARTRIVAESAPATRHSGRRHHHTVHS
ncbi:GntR family transcriptional regulator [Devosia algicola]|uniref:GntR family transcriptional regulator n=1 Tax=Devosia algicola TaxID=3026418 RepID=UPI0038994785